MSHAKIKGGISCCVQFQGSQWKFFRSYVVYITHIYPKAIPKQYKLDYIVQSGAYQKGKSNNLVQVSLICLNRLEQAIKILGQNRIWIRFNISDFCYSLKQLSIFKLIQQPEVKVKLNFQLCIPRQIQWGALIKSILI